MKIGLYGSAFMSQIAERALMCAGHQIVGHVPNHHARFPGKMYSFVITPESAPTVTPDIWLSVLYDRRITHFGNVFNIHPGLLPGYGGCNTSFWALREGEKEFGWTCHRVDETFDSGPIVSKITFPLLPGDTVPDVFERHAKSLAGFVVAAVEMIKIVGREELPPQEGGRYFPARAIRHLSPDASLAFANDGERIARYVRRHSQ